MNGLLMLAVTTPMMSVLLRTMERATESGMYFISSQILRILSRVASPISGLPESALDTVAYETFATLAISFMVTFSTIRLQSESRCYAAGATCHQRFHENVSTLILSGRNGICQTNRNKTIRLTNQASSIRIELYANVFEKGKQHVIDTVLFDIGGTLITQSHDDGRLLTFTRYARSLLGDAVPEGMTDGELSALIRDGAETYKHWGEQTKVELRPVQIWKDHILRSFVSCTV